MSMRARSSLEAAVNYDGMSWRTASTSEGGFDGVRRRLMACHRRAWYCFVRAAARTPRQAQAVVGSDRYASKRIGALGRPVNGPPKTLTPDGPLTLVR